MDIQTKVKSHSRLLRAVRQNPDISNVVVPENSDNYEFSCTICSGVSMEFNLKGPTDLLVIKAEAELKDKTEQEIYEIGSEITEDTNVRFTSYEKESIDEDSKDKKGYKIVFQDVLPVSKLEGIEGEKKIFNETMEFISLMILHKDQLECKEDGKSLVDIGFTGDDDPDNSDKYGFDTFGEDNNNQPTNTDAFNGDFTDVEPDVEQEEIQNPNGGEFETDDPFDGGVDNDPFSGIPVGTVDGGLFYDLNEPDTSQIGDGNILGGDVGGVFDGFNTDEDDEFDKLLGNNGKNPIQLNITKNEEPEQIIEQPKVTPPVRQNVRPQQPQQKETLIKQKVRQERTPTPKMPPVQETPNFDDDNDELTDMITSLETSKKNQRENRRKKNNRVETNVDIQIPVPQPRVPQANAEIQFTSKKPITEEVDEDNNFSVVKQQTRATKKEKREKKNQQPMQDLKNNNEENDTIMQTTVEYKRAPEVVEQMKHLYSEMDQLFAQRKKQADYREETLNKFSERLDKREKELAIRAERIEQNFNDSKAQLAKTTEDFETQKKEIEFQWNKLNMEKEMLETQKRDIEEREALIGKMGSLDDTSDLEEELASVNEQVKTLENQIEDYKQKIATLTENYEAKIEELNESLSNVDIATSAVEKQALEEEVRSLNEKVEDLNDEIDDLNDEISEINDISAQKDQIIQSFKDRQESWKAKESAYKSQLANAATNVGANEEMMQENADLQEKLANAVAQTRSATDRIVKLETENKSLKTMIATQRNSGANTSNKEDSETITRLNQELTQANAQLDRVTSAYDDLKNRMEQQGSASVETVDKTQLAMEAKEGLAQIGIQTEIVPGAGELMLSGYSDECQVVVNIDARILYVEKPIKRGSKYKADIDKWNQEDIRVSYMLTDKKVMCKAVYIDVSKSVMDVLGRFNTMS